MKVLECSQYFSHYKFMGIFQYGQGQLTPQTLVRSASYSNSVQTLSLSLLPERTKKIQSKMKALGCSQHYTSIFRHARADNSGVGCGIWPKF